MILILILLGGFILHQWQKEEEVDGEGRGDRDGSSGSGGVGGSGGDEPLEERRRRVISKHTDSYGP